MQELQRRRQLAAAAVQMNNGTFAASNMAMFAQPAPSMQHPPSRMAYHPHPMHLQPPSMMYSDDSSYIPASHMPMVPPDGSSYFAQQPTQSSFDATDPPSGKQLAASAVQGRWKPPSSSSSKLHYPKSKFTSVTHPSSDMTADAFADGTHGLVLDKSVLSKLLVRDESEISDEQIRSIMHNKELLTIYKKLQEEETKRQKRLDNNRKTAQMRRKKKKGLVETYETQVSELETILAKIHAHRFGQGDVQTLVDALSGIPIYISTLHPASLII
ncbi:hypothetical protein DYB35_004482 [Aphanomyces astaci]|uniref:BZIP domain-containing protein n=1 Tax=Aphanomyces astaci TaxID=112090 RepID=A0A418DN64_APHAT|nr:hypothetical protein DYB35_004482 [Aphanomyces astaci]